MFTKDKYDKVLSFYWIPAFKNDRSTVSLGSVKFCKEKPKPVSNPDMHWVKPTFEELSRINDFLIRKIRKIKDR